MKDLPMGWILERLRDLGQIDRGRSRHRPRYAEHLYGGPYPFIQTGDIKASGGRITEYSQTYSEAGLAQSRLWPAGTLCITIAANIAETGILTFPACFPDSVIGFIADETKCDVSFIEYLFRYLRNDIQRQASGSVQDNINLSTLDRLYFPLPPLPEQQRIAEILGALDDKIELNRRMNRTLEAMARALFQSWFVDFDPVHAKARGETPYGMDKATTALFPDSFEETAVGQVPRGWEVKPLDKIAEYLNGLALQKYPPQGDDFLPVIKIRELRQGFVNESSDKAGTFLKPEYIIEDGDVLFSWSGSLLVDVWCGGRGALNQHLFKVTSSQYPKWFYYFWTLHHLDEFVRIAAHKATTMGHIQRQHLSSALTIVPPIELIEAGTEIIGSLLEQIINNRLETRNLAVLRDTLLPGLVGGDIKIKHLVAITLG